MGTPHHIKNCEGFEINVAVGGVSALETRAIRDMAADIKVLVDDGLQRYELYPIWIRGELHFYRKFFWVDGERHLSIILYNQDHVDHSERLVVRISGSKSDKLFHDLYAMLKKIDLDDPDTSVDNKKPSSSWTIFNQLRGSYGEMAIDPLHNLLSYHDSSIPPRVVRVLSHFKNRISIGPLCNLLKDITDKILIMEIIKFFSQFDEPEVHRCIIQLYTENPADPKLRIKSIEILSHLDSDETRDAIQNAAEFDPEAQVQARAREVLLAMNSRPKKR
jgi:hypothetical protein